MASWANNPPNGINCTRKKWNLEDRATLNNLKFHIAEEGCSEVQFDLAKQLLNKTIEQTSDVCPEQQAVHWLIAASKQGHEEASELLRKCFENGCGITRDNVSDVRSCLSMTPGERAARKAARELFACLSNGNEHITPKQLERKMRKIYKLQKKRRRRPGHLPDSTSEEDSDSDKEPLVEEISAIGNGHVPGGGGEEQVRRGVRPPVGIDYIRSNENREERFLTEENLVTAAVHYAEGRMPTVNDELTLSIPHPASLDHVPCFHRLLFHPIIFCTLLYHRLINCISSLPTSMPQSLRIIVLFLAYWLACRENVTIFLPIAFYYLSLGIMIWATCKMLKTKHDFIDFRIWSGLFLSYGENIEADISENRFLKNNMKPYLYFFCAFFGNLIVYPMITNEWLLHSELTIISCIFVFGTLSAFMYTSRRTFPDWLVLLSFGINVLAKYPYEMDEVVKTGWRFLDLKVPTFCSFVIGNGIEFCLNCRTALYLLIPAFLVRLAKRSNWHGTYAYLIPHCVTLSWLQLCITASQRATMFGVVRGTLGLAGILLFLPLFGIVSLLIPVFVAIDWLGFTDPALRLGSTMIAATVALLGSCLMAINRNTQKYVTALQIIACIFGASVLVLPHMTSKFNDSTRFSNILLEGKHSTMMDHHTNPTDTEEVLSFSNNLNWQQFYSLCSQPSWTGQNKIDTQIRCAHLDGMRVSWEGTVSHVQIKRVLNPRDYFMKKYFPKWLANIIRCIYGERLTCDEEFDDPLCNELEEIIKNSHLNGRCSLHKWNSYEYEIRIRMHASLLSKTAYILLQADNKFGNFTRRIIAGDKVHFYGTLLNSYTQPNGEHDDFLLGTSTTHVKLSAIDCLHCEDQEITPVPLEKKSPVESRMRDLMRGIKYLLNVLLNPLITFK